jgi:hypothetical protein
LVHKKTSTPLTYALDVEQGGMAEILDNVDTSRAVVTYLPECQGDSLIHGIHYPTPSAQGIESGRCVVVINGAVGIDNTALGLVRFAEYNSMCVPLVCGCAVRDRARFERAHIPLVFVPTNAPAFRFEDSSFGRVRLFENDSVRGEIDITRKEKHGDVWWVTLERSP